MCKSCAPFLALQNPQIDTFRFPAMSLYVRKQSSHVDPQVLSPSKLKFKIQASSQFQYNPNRIPLHCRREDFT